MAVRGSGGTQTRLPVSCDVPRKRETLNHQSEKLDNPQSFSLGVVSSFCEGVREEKGGGRL